MFYDKVKLMKNILPHARDIIPIAVTIKGILRIIENTLWCGLLSHFIPSCEMSKLLFSNDFQSKFIPLKMHNKIPPNTLHYSLNLS